MSEENKLVGIPMTPELREGIIRVEMSKYLNYPCPYCKQEWKGTSDLIAHEAVFVRWEENGGVAAHKVCFDAAQNFAPTDDELATEQPATAPDGGGVTPSAFAQAAQGDNELAVALYEVAVLHTQVSDLEAQLAAAEATAAGLRRERDAAQAWSRVCETNWNDCGKALAAILKERGVSELTIGGYYIYEAMGDSADSFPVNEKGERVQQAADAKPAGGA